LRDTDFW